MCIVRLLCVCLCFRAAVIVVDSDLLEALLLRIGRQCLQALLDVLPGQRWRHDLGLDERAHRHIGLRDQAALVRLDPTQRPEWPEPEQRQPAISACAAAGQGLGERTLLARVVIWCRIVASWGVGRLAG